jgi:hypothetical protein
VQPHAEQSGERRPTRPEKEKNQDQAGIAAIAPYAPVRLVECGRVNEAFTMPLKVERSAANGTAKAAGWFSNRSR